MQLSTSTLAVLLLTSFAAGFRTVKRKGASQVSKQNFSGRFTVPRSEQGEISGLWIGGGPGTAYTPLQNYRGDDPCIPGARIWVKKETWLGKQVDAVVVGAGFAAYRHPQMSAWSLEDKDPSDREFIACNKDVPFWPRGSLNTALHDYDERYMPLLDDSMMPGYISHMAIYVSERMNTTEVSSVAKKHGWGLVNKAFALPGVGNTGGPQTSYLLQNQNTKACVVTFQSTNSSGDWGANFNAMPAHFCGIKKGRNKANVHRGFRNQLRRMVTSEQFQTNIAQHFPACSSVEATGFSLGAALAQLFTACVSNAPQEGEEGYEEDYKFMGWSPEIPRLLKLQF